MDKPKLIIITGRPGSGKSILAHLIAGEIRCPMISRDEIKEGYVNTIKTEHKNISNDENLQIYNTFFDVIGRLLDNRITLIAEAAFQNKLWFPKYEILNQKSDIKVILCKTDPELAHKRYLERKKADPLREYYHGDAPVLFENGTYEYIQFPAPTLEVNTSENYNPDLKEIVSFIRSDA